MPADTMYLRLSEKYDLGMTKIRFSRVMDLPV